MLPLHNFIMPDFLVEFFKLMNSFNFQLFDFGFIEDKLTLIRTAESYGDNFDDSGYETTNVILNAFDVFVVLV